jgi:ribonuclease HII
MNPTKKKRTKPEPLPKYYKETEHLFEIGIDEAGRGPLFGRVYVAGVVLPKHMDTTEIRDSKKLTKSKLQTLYAHIRKNAVVFHIAFVEAVEIDEINIREAVLKGMHECARECITALSLLPKDESHSDTFFLCVDGNDFPPYYHNNANTCIPYETFTGGDNRYASIAAASILAKVARDDYIRELCLEFPKLSELYGMDKHMGYGTKQHMEAILQYGITDLHRKTFGTCKGKPICQLEID